VEKPDTILKLTSNFSDKGADEGWKINLLDFEAARIDELALTTYDVLFAC
jgi:hypothetical protein